ncbi:MAG: hypothetical protein WCE94_09895 [Candidatus Methanoperedens sp.]
MNLSQFIDGLATNPWLIIIGFIITIISLLLAVIFYIKGKKVKLPYYAVNSHNIVRDLVSRIDDLDILYHGEPIENLTATKIAFWNAGNDTINGQDIARADPLTVIANEGYKILDAKIVSVINTANQFSITSPAGERSININFDYLDQNEGAIIQLLHTGKSGKDIEIHGRIKGFGKPKLKSATASRDSNSFIHVGLIFFAFPVFITVLSAANGRFYEEIKFIIFIFMLYGGIGGLISYLILKRSLPKGFKIFEEEIVN